MVKTNKKYRIFILCNGELAEPYYFQDFKNYLKIPGRIIIPKKSNFLRKAPWDLIKAAIEYKQKLESEGKFVKEDEDQMWCVFDIDNYWKENQEAFQEAIKLAKQHDIKIAWSNECFEFWFLCHFALINSSVSRTQYSKKLKNFFKDKKLNKYEKNMKGIFNMLLPFQEEAIKNAKKLYKKDQIQKNPSTSAHFLVQELLDLFE